MAYLDNSSITVDAVLTKKGREILAKGGTSFKITKFALADDEIDYSLWNPLHPSGSDYYGKVIENMPVMEALIDESQAMRYKLISIDDILSTATTVNLPYIQVSYIGGSITNGSTVSITANDSTKSIIFTPETNYTINGLTQRAGLDTTTDGFGYTFILNKPLNDIINESKGIFTDSGTQFIGIDSDKITATTQQFVGDGDFTAITRIGSSLQINLNSVGLMSQDTTFTLPITVLGNQSGTTFNMVISITVPANLKSLIASGISRTNNAV